MRITRRDGISVRAATGLLAAALAGCGGSSSLHSADQSPDAGGPGGAGAVGADAGGEAADAAAMDGSAAPSTGDAAGGGQGGQGGQGGDGATSPQPQWFYAGADIGTVLRAEAIPGRQFYDFDGKTLKDPMDVMQSAGFNAIRVETFINQCAGPTTGFDNSGNVLNRELNFQLDGGCIDVQVNTAKLAKQRAMKIVLTLNMGFDIPVAWQSYNYTQMLGAIDTEAQRQIQPFLAAGIQPDIVLLENEGSDGILYNVTINGTVHVRGVKDSTISDAEWQNEVCGQVPTGNMASYPQLAGYYKQEILSSQSALTKAGFDPAWTRFGLHSHGQYIDWKQSVVYSTDPTNETTFSSNGVTCGFKGVIPDSVLNLRADQMLDIMGFSAYPDPMTPTDPGSMSAQEATLMRLNTTLGLMDAVVTRYGRVTSGPFTGQWQKQGLGVEYATTFTYPDQIADQQAHTQLFFQALLAHDWFLGALWWEPTYCFNNWEGGNATLYHRWTSGQQTNEGPTDTLTTWGGFAESPK